MRNLVWSSNFHVESKMVCRIKKKIDILVEREKNKS